MATKKKALGRGLDSLIPEKTIQAEEADRELTDEERAGNAVGNVSLILNETLSGMESSRAERMLRMIIALCQSEMRGGYHAYRG